MKTLETTGEAGRDFQRRELRIEEDRLREGHTHGPTARDTREGRHVQRDGAWENGSRVPTVEPDVFFDDEEPPPSREALLRAEFGKRLLALLDVGRRHDPRGVFSALGALLEREEAPFWRARSRCAERTLREITREVKEVFE